MFTLSQRAAALLFAVFLLESGPAQAKRKPVDPNYIREFPGTVTVRTFAGEKISGFDLVDNSRNESLKYRPNNVLGIGLGVTIRGLGINISTRLPAHDTKDDLYGKTRQLDLQVHRYRGNFALDIYFQRYKGYHLQDNSAVSAVEGPTAYPYFPDLQNNTFGATGLYVFNGKRFSLRAPIDQQDWQMRSAGSWLLGGSLFSHLIGNNHQTLLPPNMKQPEFMDGSRISKIDNYGATVNLGYGYNFVLHRHWFVGLLADAGAGVGYSEVTDQAGSSHKVGLQLNADARLAFGYNAQKWFAGVYAIIHADRYQLPYADSYIISSEGIARLTIARRFATRKRALAKQP